MLDLLKLPRRRAIISLALLAFTFLLWTGATVRAQTGKSPLPPLNGYVNDLAEVVDPAARQRMETILNKLKEQAGIEFAIVTVKTTGGEDIFDYSLKVARAWGIGARESKKNALLLFVSVDNQKSFTHVSRRFEGGLPDGLVGEMNVRMRQPFSAGNFSEGLMTAVQTVAATLLAQRGLTIEGVDERYAYGQLHPINSAASTTTTARPATEINTAREETATKKEATAPPEKTAPATKEEMPAETAAVEKKKEESSAPKTTPSETTTSKAGASEVRAGEATKVTPTGASGLSNDEAESEQVELTLTLPPAQRVEKLKAFMLAHPQSDSITRATELLVSAYAAFGDEKLRAGDVAGAVEQFRLAIAESPASMSDKLFAGVISQLPFNLFLSNERAAALETARLIEARVKDDPKRLLALASFYLEIEDANEAARVAELVIKLAPDNPAAHQALGASRRIALRLDDAAAEYARTLELDPKSARARLSLADLSRANGKPEEALALYREQLKTDATDKQARTGMILSLFNVGKKAEAASELEAALKDDPRNLALLVGAAYWYAAHDDARRALELAQRAVEIEPRYTWANIALARALISLKRPLDAERALLFARRYGRFPTLDYELASALASAGLYEEAAEELARSFNFKDGEIETQLAGRFPAHAANFTELLAPERRASIFQAVAADTEAQARTLKGLLAFTAALNPPGGREAIKETEAVAAAREFTSGDDVMRVYRQLYAASRLLQHGVGLATVLNLAEAATNGIEAATALPFATIAVQADEVRGMRAQANQGGGTLDIPDASRNVLANILRGRIEDLAGWSLFNQDKTDEAVSHLRLAASVLPEGTPAWRTALWHLGAALEAGGNRQEALGYYIKSYNSGTPDPVRRSIIEALYRKVNGSLEGLDTKIGPG